MKAEEQLQQLTDSVDPFLRKSEEYLNNGQGLRPVGLEIVQINIGKKCNLHCRHCHVDAGLDRVETMSRVTAEQCLEIIKNVPEVTTVDLTGGAPEMAPVFQYMVTESRMLGKTVIDRCNLVILEEPGFEYLYHFLADNRVQVVASLPHFSRLSTDKMRGDGVFEKSIHALTHLNKLGYGKESDLIINLVYNPTGLFISSTQQQLEREFKEKLKDEFDIVFNNLFVINNMPINRFLASLVSKNRLEQYMDLLVNAFNPSTLDGLMCRHQISIGYDGGIYDCDFNQMLDLLVEPVSNVAGFNYDAFMSREIKVGNHCYGCTAGAGSSCGGELSE